MIFNEYLTADLPVFFNTEEFGTVAEVTPVGGGAAYTANVQKIVEPNDFGDAFYTHIVGRSADFTGIAKNDAVLMDNTSYAVVTFTIDEYDDTIEVFLNE